MYVRHLLRNAASVSEVCTTKKDQGKNKNTPQRFQCAQHTQQDLRLNWSSISKNDARKWVSIFHAKMPYIQTEEPHPTEDTEIFVKKFFPGVRRNALCCGVLQYCSSGSWARACLQHSRVLRCDAVWCSVVQCGAVWCSVVQCCAIWCNVVQSGAMCCSVLHCVAVCCSVCCSVL